MRYSKQRELIKDILKGRYDHPTADMVYASARELAPDISLGTVYRNLKVLADEGTILTLETEDKRLHYDGDTSKHSHFICKACGKIIDFHVHVETPVELKQAGLMVTDEKCVYYGFCKECREKNIN